MYKSTRYLLSAVLAPAVCGCSDGTGPSTVASIRVRPAAVSLKIGETTLLQATPLNAAGDALSDVSLQWSSSNAAIADVDADGLVTAVGAGLGWVTMTASHNGVSGSAEVEVVLSLTSVHPGGGHTCGVTPTGRLYCWGGNISGQLGSGGEQSCWGGGLSYPCNTVPAAVLGQAVYQMVSVGSSHTCGLGMDGAIYCWGSSQYGQLGMGDTERRGQPTALPGDLTFASVHAGYTSTFAITTDGVGYAWGSGEGGVLGIGTDSAVSTPTAMVAGLDLETIDAYEGHACGLSVDGAAYCWGFGEYGKLGAVATDSCDHWLGYRPCCTSSVAVQGGLTFETVTVGPDHACGLSHGTAYCWGVNFNGQLGAPGLDSSYVPVHVSGGLTFLSISAGASHTCGLSSDGKAYCWGHNEFGQLGTGLLHVHEDQPTEIDANLRFEYLEAGYSHTCGITVTGLTYCWGANHSGQLGNGSTWDSPVPVLVKGQENTYVTPQLEEQWY